MSHAVFSFYFVTLKEPQLHIWVAHKQIIPFEEKTLDVNSIYCVIYKRMKSSCQELLYNNICFALTILNPYQLPLDVQASFE